MTLQNSSWLSSSLAPNVRLQIMALVEQLLKAYHNPFEAHFDGEAALNSVAVLLEQQQAIGKVDVETEKSTEKKTEILSGKVEIELVAPNVHIKPIEKSERTVNETETTTSEQLTEGHFTGALACLYASQGQFKAAERWLKLAEQQAPKQGFTLWAKAMWALHLGLASLAEEAYAEAFNTLPNWAKLASGLQWLQLLQDKPNAAAADKSVKSLRKLLFSLTLGLYGKQAVSKAWPMLKQFFKTKPWQNLNAEQATQATLSLELSSALFSLTPGWADFGIHVVEQLQAQNKLDSALMWSQRLLHRHPAHTGVLWSVLRTYKSLGRPLEALRTAEKLYALQPNNPEVCLTLGNLYEATEQSHRAMEPYLQVLVHGESNAISAAASMRLGHLAMQQGAPKEWTFSCFTMAAMADPNLRTEARHLMGLLAFEQGWLETAQAVSYQALAEEKQTRQAALHWSHIGYLNSLRQHWGKAVGAYEQALQLDKNMDVALNNLGVIYMDCLGQAEQAKPLLERAVVANPAYATAFFNLGRYLNEHNEPNKAEVCFNRAHWLQAHPHELPDEDALSSNISQGALGDSFSGAFPWQWLFNADDAEKPSPSSGEASGL